MHKFYLIISIYFLLSCSSNLNQSKDLQEKKDGNIEYAKGFSLTITDSCKILTVSNPWQGAEGIRYTYYFVDSSKRCNLIKSAIVEVFPISLSRIICLSTSHIAFIDILKKTSTIIGVSGSSFVSSENLGIRIKSNDVKDVGYDQNLNYELIVSLKPDAVLCYGIGAESVGYLLKLKALGIKLIFVGDYLEENPLGKAEWVKFFGTLLNLNNYSDSVFKSIEFEYNKTILLAKAMESKPRVFLNLPWKDSWFFPGGSNYFVKLIEDAGGDYVFKNLQGSKSYAISFEKAIEAGMSADIWLNPGASCSLSDIKQTDERLLTLTPCYNSKVYNNNLRSSPARGNDFWESGVVHPDLILKDLIYIFHPNLLPKHKFYYYKKIE